MERPEGGFNFDLTNRNKFLAENVEGMQHPQAKKTGTTIAGIVFKDGIVLGADTRATGGSVVADKNCAKIHYLQPNIWCCGAGTAADCDHVTEMMSSNLTLHCMNTGKQCRVTTAVTMLAQMLFRYQGYIGTALVIGGVDCTGAHLYTVWPHGSVDKLPFVTMGSGCLAAMSIFESEYDEKLEREPAKDLVRAAINAGITNDLGSGSNCDICVITKDGHEMFRNIDKMGGKYTSTAGLRLPRGTTDYYNEKISQVRSRVVVEDGAEPMEL